MEHRLTLFIHGTKCLPIYINASQSRSISSYVKCDKSPDGNAFALTTQLAATGPLRQPTRICKLGKVPSLILPFLIWLSSDGNSVVTFPAVDSLRCRVHRERRIYHNTDVVMVRPN